ncbi:hypothetical protein [Microbacterium sp.]|uniref:hypothetical protein n=1 Tax=Microbacterium sp. TaxID=51671 RepID=UPI0039E4D602
MADTDTIPVQAVRNPTRGFFSYFECLGPAHLAAQARLYARDAAANADEILARAHRAAAEEARRARTERLGPELEWIP